MGSGTEFKVQGAAVEFNYVKRHVISGENIYTEYNQSVTFEAACKKDAVVVSAGDIYVPLWAITDRRYSIEIADDMGFGYFYFTDPTAADAMAQWMMRQRVSFIGKRALRLHQLPDLTNKLGGSGSYPA